MQTVSALFEELWQGEHLVETKLVINGVTYLDEDIISVVTSHILFSDNQPQVGSVVAGTIDIEIIAPNVIVPKRASVKPYVRLTDPEKTQFSEWIQKGEFFTDRRYTDDNDILRLTAYDALLKTERLMYTTTGQQDNFPMSDIDMVTNIATDIGVAVDARTVALMVNDYQVQYPGFGEAGYTEREILSFIGGMYGGNWCISDVGELRLVTLESLAPETYYLVTELGEPITFGGDRIIWNR